MKRWIIIGAIVVASLVLVTAIGMLLLPRIYSEDAATSWTYHFPKYDVIITVPSSDWQEVQKQGSDAAFHNRKRSALVGVNVTKGDQDAFRKSIKRMKEYMEDNRDELLSEPQFTEGTTDANNPFALWMVQAKADGGTAVFWSRSLVWCKEKRLIVSVMMEAPLTMQSRVGKKAEMDFFEKAAKTICLSAR